MLDLTKTGPPTCGMLFLGCTGAVECAPRKGQSCETRTREGRFQQQRGSEAAFMAPAATTFRFY
jgi:hypothetical protein